MVTEDGVYIPVADSIVKLDHSNGRPISQVGVKLPDGLPVGNLFSDGKHIYTIAMNQLHMLGSLPQHLALLNRRIDGGDRGALYDRTCCCWKHSEWKRHSPT